MKKQVKQTPRQRALNAIALHANRITGFDPKLDHDQKLQELSKGVGSLARMFGFDNLARIGAYTSGWADLLQQKGEDGAISLINLERDRQDQLLREGKLLYNCASPVASDRRKLRALVEELGEVASAIDRIERDIERGVSATVYQGNTRHLRTELIQVAAVSVAWLESMEEKQ